MAAKTEEIKVRVSPQVKAEAQAVLDHWGMSMSQAVGLFLTKVADTGGIPFDLTVSPAIRAFEWAEGKEWASDEERYEHEAVYARLHAGERPASGEGLRAAALSSLGATGA